MSETQVEQTEESSAGSRTVRVSRTIAAPVLHVWETLVSGPGTEAILGAGAALGNKGESWHNDEGQRGVVRSFHPLEQLRLSWHASDDAPMSMVEIDLGDDGGQTRLDLIHDRSGGPDWDVALDRFEQVVRA